MDSLCHTSEVPRKQVGKKGHDQAKTTRKHEVTPAVALWYTVAEESRIVSITAHRGPKQGRRAQQSRFQPTRYLGLVLTHTMLPRNRRHLSPQYICSRRRPHLLSLEEDVRHPPRHGTVLRRVPRRVREERQGVRGIRPSTSPPRRLRLSGGRRRRSGGASDPPAAAAGLAIRASSGRLRSPAAVCGVGGGGRAGGVLVAAGTGAGAAKLDAQRQ